MFMDHRQKRTSMGRKHSPQHLGNTLREDVLPTMGVTVADVTRQAAV